MYKILLKEELAALEKIAKVLKEREAYLVIVDGKGLKAFLVADKIPFKNFCKSHASGTRLIMCPKPNCKREFRSLNALAKHLMKEHDKELNDKEKKVYANW